MEPYLRVYDRSGDWAPVRQKEQELILKAMHTCMLEGTDALLSLRAFHGGYVHVRVSDIVSVVEINEGAIRKDAERTFHEQRVYDEAHEQLHPSWS